MPSLLLTEKRSPRLLIAARTLFELRAHYEEILVCFVRAGVDVTVRYLDDKRLDRESYLDTLRARGIGIEVRPLSLKPSRRSGHRADLLALRLRQLANLLRYRHPDYRDRAWQRERWLASTPSGPRKWAVRLGRLGSRPALLVTRLIGAVDRVLPPSESARAVVAETRPDAVVTVGIVRNPELVDVMKAAAEARVPTATWIQSWDNLTTKGLLHFAPDRVFVWNEIQRDELARYHGVPSSRACVTGAQSFDHWFEDAVPTKRETFCREYGVDPERPILLYLSSSRLIEPPPDVFFLRWLDAIRSSDDSRVANAFVLVRPHPLDARHWVSIVGRHEDVQVSRAALELPAHSPEFRARYRDELHHASVAVGVNTSAMIEAAIMGTPVCTVEDPDLASRQRGTVHFQYLLEAGGGLLRSAPTFPEHVAQLGELVGRDPYERDELSTRFVQAFVRPNGLDVRPGDVFLDESLRLFGARTQVRLPGVPGRVLGRLIRWTAPLAGAPLLDENRIRARRLQLRRAIHGHFKRVRHFVLIVVPRAALLRYRRLVGAKHPQAP